MYATCRFPERKPCLERTRETEDCTKECLRTLEVELGVVKRFPDQNAAILGKVECRNVLRGRFLELEGRMRDPGRCNNHGGRLLLQERERKFLEKLPRLGRETMKHNEAHEVEGSALFLEWTAALRNHLNTQFASYQEGGASQHV